MVWEDCGVSLGVLYTTQRDVNRYLLFKSYVEGIEICSFRVIVENYCLYFLNFLIILQLTTLSD